MRSRSWKGARHPVVPEEGRNVRLTKQGREFDEYITQALDLIDKAVDIAHEQAGSRRALSIWVSSTPSRQIICRHCCARIGTLRERHYHQYVPGLTTQLVEDLESGRYDVVFGSYVEGKEDDLGFIPVDSQRLVAVVHDYSPFAKRESVTIEDLSHSKIYSYSPDIPLGKEVRKICRECCDRDLDIHATAEDEITLGSWWIPTRPQSAWFWTRWVCCRSRTW